MERGEPGYALEQLIGTTLYQDWQADHDTPYEALEEWFVEVEGCPDVLEPLLADLDWFASVADESVRVRLWAGTGVGQSEVPALLVALRDRAVSALKGEEHTLRAPVRPPATRGA